MKKKVILILCTIIIAIPLMGLLWWLFPYIHAVKGVDEEAGYKYTLEGKYCYLTKYIGEEEVVYIPEQLRGRKTLISCTCFISTDIEVVYVPSTMEIPPMGFYDCRNLKKFYGSSNKTIYESTYGHANSLEEIIFTNKIERVEPYAFWDCSSINTVDFIEDVKYIGDCAFMESNIEEIPVMENIEYVGEYAFYKTPWEESLKSDFVIAGDTMLMYKGTEKEVHIPDGVLAVRGPAFVNQVPYEESMGQEPYGYVVPVEEVYIPSTVKVLGNSIFVGQEDVTVYIPDSVIEIGICENGDEIGLGGGIKIVTTAGSYAEEYAKKNDIAYEIVDGWN